MGHGKKSLFFLATVEFFMGCPLEKVYNSQEEFRRVTLMFDPKKPLLLVVADDLGRLTYLDSLLGRKGNYLVTTCSTHPDAEKALAGHKVDLIIVAKMGEEADEIGLIWKVKHLSPKTKAILLYDSPDWAASVAPIDSGADELLTAPYTDDELLETIQRLLAAP